MSPVIDKTAHLPEELGMYVDTLRKRHPAIDQVWLLGRPAGRGSDGAWELLSFGDAAALEALRQDTELHRDDVVFLVVTDGEQFAAAWGDGPHGTLRDIGWRLANPHSAVFRADGADEAVATRVR